MAFPYFRRSKCQCKFGWAPVCEAAAKDKRGRAGKRETNVLGFNKGEGERPKEGNEWRVSSDAEANCGGVWVCEWDFG